MLRITLLLLTALLLNGCASSLKLQIDAINTPGYKPVDHPYQLLSGDPNINDNDLYYQEFSRYARQALKQAGLTHTKQAEESDQRIYFSYGVADGGTERYRYSTPIYEFVGGDTYTVTERSVTGGTVESKTTEVHVPFSRQIVGRDHHTRTIKHYRSFIRLEGRDNTEAATQRWMVTVELISESNDLRSLLPLMMSHAAPLIGKNSGKVLQRSVPRNDPQTLRFIDEANAAQ